MRPKILLLIAGIFGLFWACNKNESDKLCNNVPVGNDLHFRFTDTAYQDLLSSSPALLMKDSLFAWQPCRTDPLVPFFTTYRVPGTMDSGIVLHFGNLRTPIYGENGECYRLFFRWSSTDVDTLDWHYHLEEANGCTLQVIDYISYNGIQAEKKTDYAYEYYRLVKQE